MEPDETEGSPIPKTSKPQAKTDVIEKMKKSWLCPPKPVTQPEHPCERIKIRDDHLNPCSPLKVLHFLMKKKLSKHC